MGGLLSFFKSKPPREPIKRPSCVPCANLCSNNYRGILTTIFGVLFLVLFIDNKHRESTVIAVTYTTATCFLFAPVPVAACSLLPVFMLPMFGVLSSATCCGYLINENIVFFFVGGWLLMLLNNCGTDKRLICRFLACGSEKAFTPQKLLLKSCFAAFFGSALSNRELVTQATMNYVVSALQPLQTFKGEANYLEAQKIICNAVAISSILGSLCIMHSAITTMQMRSLYSEALIMEHTENQDVFNFLNYSVFAVPMVLLMFMLTIGIQTLFLSKHAPTKKVPKYSQDLIQKALVKNQKDLGRMSAHEKVSTFFFILLLICYFTRWSKWLNMGWGSFRKYPAPWSPGLCGLKDATTACIFIIVLHFLPKSFNFLKIFSVQKHRDKPVMKVESGILFWKFIDKNTDYSLFLALGAGALLFNAITATGASEIFNKHFGDSVFGLSWNIAIFVIVFISVFTANIMSGIGAQAINMPVFLATVIFSNQGTWFGRSYLVALGVGIGSALGFCFPSPNSPLRYVRTIGKVEWSKQVKYSIMPVIVCTIVLWLFLCFYAPILWDPNNEGLTMQSRPIPPSIFAEILQKMQPPTTETPEVVDDSAVPEKEPDKADEAAETP